MSGHAIPTGEVTRITFMLSLPDMARVDAALIPGKTYYRFATDDSIEDGELRPDEKLFEPLAQSLLGVFEAESDAASPGIEPLQFTLFVNNVRVTPATLTRATLRSFANLLADAHPEFGFMHSVIAAR